MVGLGRLERPTSPLSGVRSNHLSYRPEPVQPAPPHGSDPRARRRSPACPDEKEKRGRPYAVRPAKRGLTGPMYPMTHRDGRTREDASLERR